MPRLPFLLCFHGDFAYYYYYYFMSYDIMISQLRYALICALIFLLAWEYSVCSCIDLGMLERIFVSVRFLETAIYGRMLNAKHTYFGHRLSNDMG
jgi:hypothetical protein